MEMPKKEIQLWIDELRSGKWTQTQFQLQDDVGLCCLGVACKILIPKEQQLFDRGYLGGVVPADQAATPGWLRTINLDFKHRCDVYLSELNDALEHRLTFDEIADCLQAVYIEEVLND